MSKPMTRDPYLPSPEVCDWLLAQEWSKPATMHINGPDRQSEIYECCRATAALGADECIDLVLPSDGIKMLREDQRRRAEAIERKRAGLLRDEEEMKRKRDAAKERETRKELDWYCSSSADPRTALTERILAEAKQSNLTVNQAADVLHAAAQSLVAWACSATLQDSQP